jgi:hypothetical protein
MLKLIWLAASAAAASATAASKAAISPGVQNSIADVQREFAKVSVRSKWD